MEKAIPLPKLLDGAESNNIKVCVRVRPFNSRELALQKNPQSCVSMPSQTEVVLAAIPADAIEEGSQPQAARRFEYDRTYWSMDASKPNFSSQQTLMDELGLELKHNVLHGYNSCIFAYGQTGSGKTFSILGSDCAPENKGLLPRIVGSIFQTVAQLNTGVESTDEPVCSCHLTYLEIYNEQLRDLLVPPGETPSKLIVMASPTMGVIVQGIKEIPVFTGDDVLRWLDMGTRARTVGQTCMNAQSSRSHCVFSLEIHRTTIDEHEVISHLHSKLVSVDLAGSERQSKTQSSGARLMEGAKINQSLTNLSIVINKLAEASDKKGRGADNSHVPFRNSKLTYVLQNSLSGNSKTVMMAAISPSANNWEESLSTLNFARSVKKIKTLAAKNELSKESIVEALRREIDELKAQQTHSGRQSLKEDEEADSKALALQDAMKKYGHDFETQLQIAQKHQKACTKALEDMGLNLSDISGACGMKSTTPQLVNVSHDPSLQGCLVYFLERGNRTIRIGSEKGCGGIVLQGLGIAPCNAHIHNHDDISLSIERVDGRVIVNGQHISNENRSCPLRNGDRLILGYSFCFRVAIPLAVEDVAAQEQDWHSLEQALMEVMPGDMEAYENCHLFAEHLQMRLGASKSQAFLKEFQRLSTLVEEANAITNAVRPQDHLLFTVEVLTDLYKYVTEEPECVVRLKRKHVGAKELTNGTKTSLRSKTVVMPADDLRFVRTNTADGPHYSTIALFDTKAFNMRMEHMREIYELFEVGTEIDLDRPEHNPWREIPPWEFEHVNANAAQAESDDPRSIVSRIISVHNRRTVAAASLLNAQMPLISEMDEAVGDGAGSDTEMLPEVAEPQRQHDQDRANWLACEMVYCRKIEALEQENAEMRSRMATSHKVLKRSGAAEPSGIERLEGHGVETPLLMHAAPRGMPMQRADVLGPSPRRIVEPPMPLSVRKKPTGQAGAVTSDSRSSVTPEGFPSSVPRPRSPVARMRSGPSSASTPLLTRPTEVCLSGRPASSDRPSPRPGSPTPILSLSGRPLSPGCPGPCRQRTATPLSVTGMPASRSMACSSVQSPGSLSRQLARSQSERRFVVAPPPQHQLFQHGVHSVGVGMRCQRLDEGRDCKLQPR